MLISIIIPVFNKEKYINDCLKSVLNQNYKNLEIIVINDGSTDNSGNIIKKWMEKDSRIKYIYQKNNGVASARNKGIEIAKGDYIFFLDADDLIKENTISTLVKYAKIENPDIIAANYCKYIDGRIVKYPDINNKLLSSEDLRKIEVILDMFIINNRTMSTVTNKLFKTKFLKNNELFFRSGVIAEDRLFCLMCYSNNPKIKLINEFLYIYKIIKNSRSNFRNFTIENYIETISLFNIFYDYIKYKSLMHKYKDLLQMILIYDINKILEYTLRFSGLNIFFIRRVVENLRDNKKVREIINNIPANKKILEIKNKEFTRLLKTIKLFIRNPYYAFSYKLIIILIKKVNIILSEILKFWKFNNLSK